MQDYPWYLKLSPEDKSLQQGDIIKNCPIVKPPKDISLYQQNNKNFPLEIDLMDVVVVSQSCDIENENLEFVLVCPYFTFKNFCQLQQKNTPNKEKTLFSDLKKARMFSYHLLNKDESANIIDYLVIDFRNIYGIDLQVIKNHINENIEERIRLAPPYREHLSQSFARFFMRVGLPVDIESPFN